MTTPSIFTGHTFRKLRFFSDEQKLRFLTIVARLWSRNGPVREYAVKTIMGAGIAPRDYENQVRALLREVQSWYYVWEKEETFQSPTYTQAHRFGDCDDFSVALASMLESIDIPAELELIGHIAEDGKPEWSHIYVRVGLPPRKPTRWLACETTRKLELGAEPAEWLRNKEARAKEKAAEQAENSEPVDAEFVDDEEDDL